MLVLSRKKGEIIVLGGHIEVCVIEIRGDKVRLGINAPKDMTVHRKEIQAIIDRKQKSKGE